MAAAVRASVAPWLRGETRGAELVAHQREYARILLRACSGWSEAEIAALRKDERDAPLPFDGRHWSLSHCATQCAACVHTAPVGIDVEDRASVRAEVVERVLSPAELALFEHRGEAGFLRAWTAKEAVLKEFGVGIGGLSRCTIREVAGASELVLDFDGARRRVWQLVQSDYVVSVSSADDARVECEIRREPLVRAASGDRWR